MTEQAQPGIALIVTNLADSMTFYVKYVGFVMVEKMQDADQACIIDSDGDMLLLAGPTITDVKSLLDEPRIVFKPGDTLEFHENNLEAKHAELIERGLSPTDMRFEEIPNVARKLIIKDPSGYTLVFVQTVQQSPEETRALYARGGDILEETLAGLSETQLDLSRAPDQWTIRQIVHHLAEGESLFLMIIKTAIALPGRTLVRPPYDQEHWVDVLKFSERPVEPSLTLVKAIRRQVSQLLEYASYDWEQSIELKFAEGETLERKISLGQLINIEVRHLAEHCEEIRQTRQVHSV